MPGAGGLQRKPRSEGTLMTAEDPATLPTLQVENGKAGERADLARGSVSTGKTGALNLTETIMAGFNCIFHHTSPGNVWGCFALSVAAHLQTLYLTRECDSCRSRHHGGDWQQEAGTSARELAQQDFERSRGWERRGFEKDSRDEDRPGALACEGIQRWRRSQCHITVSASPAVHRQRYKAKPRPSSREGGGAAAPRQ